MARSSSRYDQAMVGFSEAMGPLLAGAYRFGPGTVVDVGGGRGALLAGVLQRQPDPSVCFTTCQK
jgi:hypothetical protein